MVGQVRRTIAVSGAHWELHKKPKRAIACMFDQTYTPTSSVSISNLWY